MDRLEHVVGHGNFRVVASAEKIGGQHSNRKRWKVLVSLWPLGKDPPTSTPEMIHFENGQESDPGEALGNAIALVQRRIDERRQ